MKNHKTSKLISLVAVSALILFFSFQGANLRGNRAAQSDDQIPKVHIRTSLNYWESYARHSNGSVPGYGSALVPGTPGC
jgi:hypothetical protein